jgi:hypothetical protein
MNGCEASSNTTLQDQVTAFDDLSAAPMNHCEASSDTTEEEEGRAFDVVSAQAADSQSAFKPVSGGVQASFRLTARSLAAVPARPVDDMYAEAIPPLTKEQDVLTSLPPQRSTKALLGKPPLHRKNSVNSFNSDVNLTKKSRRGERLSGGLHLRQGEPDALVHLSLLDQLRSISSFAESLKPRISYYLATSRTGTFLDFLNATLSLMGCVAYMLELYFLKYPDVVEFFRLFELMLFIYFVSVIGIRKAI